MLLFTSSALTSRAVAYCLAIFVLFGGLASLHIHGAWDLADAERSKAASATSKSFAKDNVEFSWDMVRIRVDLLTCTSTFQPPIPQ